MRILRCKSRIYLNAGKLTSKRKRREKVKMREISTMVYKRLMIRVQNKLIVGKLKNLKWALELRLKKEENHVRDQDGGAALSNADFRDILSQKKRKTVFTSQIGRFLDRKINESFPLSKIEKKAGIIFAKFSRIFTKFYSHLWILEFLAKQMKSKLARAMQKITPGWWPKEKQNESSCSNKK